MRKIVLALAIYLLAVLTAWAGEEYLADPEAEPSGFRELKWGQSIASIPGMVELYRDDEAKEVSCSRKDDDLTFGGAKLAMIEYIFYDDGLARVAVVAKGQENEDALLREARRLFGRETVQNGDDSLWRFTNVAVMFSREPSMEQSVLFYQRIIPPNMRGQ